MTAASMKETLGLDLLKGHASGISELRSSVVRVFISSTFSDMSSERDALLEKAYPELQVYCQSLGLVFEVVDMRWGVRDTIVMDHMTTELCLQEIQSCRRVSVGPTFTALVGNRYGYRPIPRVIRDEEFELLLSKLHPDGDAVKLLSQWFWKDENSVPPVYILQPITTHLRHYDDNSPGSQLQRERDIRAWQTTEAQLSRLLRVAAAQAETDGDFTQEQKHRFFKSVTEWEIEQGMLEGQNNETYAVLFLRELPNLSRTNSQESVSQFIDVTRDGLVDLEAQELLSSLKARISSFCSGQLNVHSVQLSKGAIDPQRQEHAKYLQSLCKQFVSQMKQQISRRAAQTTGEKEWGWLLREITHHIVLSLAKCAVFCGRGNLLNTICKAIQDSNNSHHGPLIVYGPSGIGKTAIMCKLAQEVYCVLGSGAAVVLRLLGTSPLSSEIDSVLKTICFQICGAFGLPFPTTQTANTYEDLVRFFHRTLDAVSQQNEPLVLILDSLDQLSPSNNAHKLHWLPKEIPPNVHLIVSTLEKGYSILEVLRGVTLEPQSFFKVEQLSQDQGGEVIDSYMSAVKRCLTPAQRELVLQSFSHCGHPLLMKLTLDAAKQWTSYTPLSELRVASTTQEAVSLLFERLEKQHGEQLVSHALGYIVLSKRGLTEAELQDVLSLDDAVLADIYQYWPPPNHEIIRLPPLLWTRLRHDLAEYLVERQSDGTRVLGLYHRQFIEMVQKRYLSAERRSQSHSILSEFFLGTWSQGNRKPVLLPSLKTSLSADRKVAPQPLWFTKHVANRRKLQELPYHLLHAGRWEELRQEVIGNTDWLCCKTLTWGIAEVIEDLSMCTEHSDSPELQLIRDTCLLLKPTLDFIEGQMDPSLFYTEVFTRLCCFADSYPSLIGRLCVQCQEWFSACKNPILIPQCGFFQAPGGPLKTTLTGFQKGVTVMDLCAEKGLLIVGSEEGRMIVWNLLDTEVVHTLIGHTAEVQSVKVLDKGARCLSASRDSTLRLWDLLSGKQIYCINEGPFGAPVCTQRHVTEQRGVIYSTCGSQMSAWDLETAELLFHIEGGDAAVFAVLQGKGAAVVSLSDEGVLTFWDSTTGLKQRACSLTDDLKLTWTCVLPLRTCGRVVAGSREGSVYLVSDDERCSVANVSSSVSFLAVSDDETVLCAGYAKHIAMFRVTADSMERFLAQSFEHEDIVLTAAIAENLSVVVTGSLDETIRVWCLSQGLLLDSFTGMGAAVTGLALLQDTVVSASRSAYYLKLWQLDYNRSHKTKPPFPGRSLLPTLSHSGDFVYFLRPGDRREVVVWDCQSGRCSEERAVSAEVSCLEVAQSRQLLFCGLQTGTVLIYPLGFGPEAMCIPPPESLSPVLGLAVSKQEDRLAVAYEDAICVFEISPGDAYPTVERALGKLPLPGPGRPWALSCAAVLSDCRVLYGADSGQVWLRDLGGSEAVALEGHRTKVTCIAVSNSEEFSLVGSQDSVQRLWRLSPLLLDHEMNYKGFFFEGILCAVFSEDDRYVFTGSQDRTIKVWETSSGRLLAVQYVYASVPEIVAWADGFVAISQLGFVIKERFRCPESIDPQYDPLRNVRAQCEVTSRKTAASLPLSSGTAAGLQAQHRRREQKSRSSQMCALF
ncbi:NACHT domain- and WD repeat-containing protein 1 [Lepisosteus oculatus]|uniref:NACHT domain- and WD repeat-containing protein 1 n=1 Tax=Lepisosteus oculatus TaxID=7918 RepID=UPI003718D5A2